MRHREGKRGCGQELVCSSLLGGSRGPVESHKSIISAQETQVKCGGVEKKDSHPYIHTLLAEVKGADHTTPANNLCGEHLKLGLSWAG